jgi:hypothetical protein
MLNCSAPEIEKMNYEVRAEYNNCRKQAQRTALMIANCRLPIADCLA